METAIILKKVSKKSRYKSMRRVDLRRMRKSKLFYILVFSAFIMPVLITVMMTMMDGTVSIDRNTGAQTVLKGPESLWQLIGSFPTEASPQKVTEASQMGGMDVMGMCNINMMFMLVSIFVCLFVCDDFRSGYVKNLFTVRAKKGDYVASKCFVGFICGAAMLTAYLLGSVLGSAICGLSFALENLNILNIAMCILSKIFLMQVFVAIFVLISVASKQKAWLAICGSLFGGMLLFMMVPMITPLNSTPLNLVMCLAGGLMFTLGLGAVSKTVLNKTALV